MIDFGLIFIVVAVFLLVKMWFLLAARTQQRGVLVFGWVVELCMWNGFWRGLVE